MVDLHYATLLEAAAAIRSRRVSPVELTRAMLDRIAAIDPALHSYATVTPELALSQAKAAEAELVAGNHRGPLHGVPIAVKDLCYTAGTVTAVGMTIHADHVPSFDATVVTRLAAAGAVLLGKLQLTEGAFVFHHPSIEPPRNPWNPDYYAGASSSGSGVATAAGLCFGSLGSDTAGSIRFPSAANGITGLKPTWGRVSRHGIFPLAASLDHIGPMTRSAADCGAMLAAIAGLDPHDPTTLAAAVPDYLAGIDGGVRGARIGVDALYNEKGCDPAVVGALQEALKTFGELGATIKEIKLPDPDEVIASAATYCSVEIAIAHEETYPSRAAEYGSLAKVIDAGRAVSAVELMKAHHQRLSFSGARDTLLGRRPAAGSHAAACRLHGRSRAEAVFHAGRVDRISALRDAFRHVRQSDPHSSGRLHRQRASALVSAGGPASRGSVAGASRPRISAGDGLAPPPSRTLRPEVMKLMIDGVWRGDMEPTPELEAQRMIHAGRFRDRVTADGSSGFRAEAGRYHLYVSYACPFSHRVIVVHALKRLAAVVGLSVVHPLWDTPHGWALRDTGLSTPDRAGNGFVYLHEA